MDVDLYDPAFVADPYPHLEEIRSRGRVVRNELLGVWMVAGYRDTLEIKHHSERFTMTVYGDKASTPFFDGAATMISSDPPEHERLRGVVSRAFTRAAVERLESRISELADELIEVGLEARESGGFDLLGCLARPLPTIVISELLGVSPDDRAQFNEWSEAIVSLAAGVRAGDVAERFRRAETAGVAMRAYLRQVIDDHRIDTRHDLIGELVASNEGDRMSEAELVAACVLMLVAGNETTAKTIAGATELLARYPDQRQRLVDDPSAIQRAIEEVLRFESISQGAQRRVVHDIDFGGQHLRAGDVVMTLTGAANRDPDVFEAPQSFDVARWPNPHIAFGHGLHFCLGAPLARLEAKIAVTVLLSKIPRFDVGNTSYGANFNVRGLERATIYPEMDYVRT